MGRSFPLQRRVNLWFCDLDSLPAPSADEEAVLAPEEWIRAVQAADPARQGRLIKRDVYLRRLLGQALEVAPQDVEFRAGRTGKPELLSVMTRPLRFSLADSENVLLVALCDDEVGVDVEVMRPGVDVMDVALQHFSPEEMRVLTGLPAPERELAFYFMWTALEAVAKAQGRACAAPAFARCTVAEQDGCPRWDVCSFRLELGATTAVAAVAVQAEG